MSAAKDLELYVDEPIGSALDEVGVSVVGAILTADWETDSQVVGDVFHDVPPAAFSDEPLREIYKAERKVFQRDGRADVITLAAELKTRGTLERVGGAEMLSKLLEAVPTSAHLVIHGGILLERARRAEVKRALVAGLESLDDPDADVDDIEEGILQDLEALNQSKNGGQHPVTLAELLTQDPDLLAPREPVIQGLAWRGRVSLLHSREKVGKSTIMGAASSSLTSGRPFLGRTPDAPARVLLFNLEEHRADAAQRAVTFGADAERLYLLGWTPTPLSTLRRAIREVDPALVVVDTLASYAEAAAPDSGSSSEWKAVIGPLVRLARDHETALVILHHSTKGTGDYRDSTAIGAEVDMLISMKEGDVPGLRNLEPKGRWKVDPFSVIYEEAPDVPPWFRLTDGELSVDAKVLLFLKEHPGASKSDIRAAVSGRNQDIDQTVFRLLDNQSIEDRGDNRCRAFYIRQESLGAKAGGQ